MKAGTTYPVIIGNVIKQLRDQKGISQGEMAQVMGVSQAAWSKLENGKATLSTSQVARAADHLGTSANVVMQYADMAVDNFKSEGMAVTYDNKDAENSGLMLLGAAAIGAIIALIVFSKK